MSQFSPLANLRKFRLKSWKEFHRLTTFRICLNFLYLFSYCSSLNFPKPKVTFKKKKQPPTTTKKKAQTNKKQPPQKSTKLPQRKIKGKKTQAVLHAGCWVMMTPIDSWGVSQFHGKGREIYITICMLKFRCCIKLVIYEITVFEYPAGIQRDAPFQYSIGQIYSGLFAFLWRIRRWLSGT